MGSTPPKAAASAKEVSLAPLCVGADGTGRDRGWLRQTGSWRRGSEGGGGLNRGATLDADQAFIGSQLRGETKAHGVRSAIRAYLAYLEREEMDDWEADTDWNVATSEHLPAEPRLP